MTVAIRGGRATRFIRYAAGSALATGASAGMFALAYHSAGAGPQLASVLAFLAGLIVNFTASRFWAFGRRQRQGMTRDLGGYAVIAVVTAVAAVAVTTLAERYAQHAHLAAGPRTVVVEGSYFAVYAAMFLAKFLLLDRLLFAPPRRGATRAVDTRPAAVDTRPGAIDAGPAAVDAGPAAVDAGPGAVNAEPSRATRW